MTVACSHKYYIDVNEVSGKVENYFRQTEQMTPASSFDGTNNITFRLMVDEPVSEDEATSLFNLVLLSFERYSPHANFWNQYNGYFDLKSYDSGKVIYEATKLIRKDFQLTAQTGDGY